MSRPVALNEFNWRERGYKYGSKEYHQLWREVNNAHSRDYHRKYDKKMYKLNPEREQARRQRYVLKYPERIQANKAVARALKTGELVRQPCEVCGNTQAIAHHPNYKKQLEVLWLCEVHHKEWHRVNVVA